MLRRVMVGDNERVFLIRKGDFEDILAPGDHWIVGMGVEMERHDLTEIVLFSAWTDFLVKERWELTYRYFINVETDDSDVAVVYFNDKVSRVIGPSCRVLFWRGPVEVTYDLIDARANPQVPASLVPAIARLGRDSQATFGVIEEGTQGFFYVEGRLIRRLLPGTYGFWQTPALQRVEIRHMVDYQEETTATVSLR